MFDHEKLSPGPWEAYPVDTEEGSFDIAASKFGIGNIDIGDDAKGIVAMRNALAIQLETGWHAERSLDDLSAWFVVQTFVEMSQSGHDEIYHPTPVHAILAAWEWSKKREGK